MKQKIIIFLLALVMLVSSVGCGSSNASEDSSTNNESSQATIIDKKVDSDTDSEDVDILVAVILKTLNSEYWATVAAGINQAADDLGVDVLLQGPPSESSYDEQYSMIETTLANSDVDAMVISPLQPDSAATAVKDANIPILAVDTTFNSDKLLSFVGCSNYDVALEGGKYMAEKLGNEGNCIILAGVQGDITSEDRINGWTDGLEDGGVTVLAVQYTDAVSDKAVTAVESMIQTYPDQIDGVVCHSDDVAMGAVNAVLQQNKQNEILVCGLGGISGAEPVRDGELTATIDIGPYQMGYDCIVKAVDAVNGKELESFYPTQATVIDSDNIDDYLIKLENWTK